MAHGLQPAWRKADGGDTCSLEEVGPTFPRRIDGARAGSAGSGQPTLGSYEKRKPPLGKDVRRCPPSGLKNWQRTLPHAWSLSRSRSRSRSRRAREAPGQLCMAPSQKQGCTNCEDQPASAGKEWAGTPVDGAQPGLSSPPQAASEEERMPKGSSGEPGLRGSASKEMPSMRSRPGVEVERGWVRARGRRAAGHRRERTQG